MELEKIDLYTGNRERERKRAIGRVRVRKGKNEGYIAEEETRG